MIVHGDRCRTFKRQDCFASPFAVDPVERAINVQISRVVIKSFRSFDLLDVPVTELVTCIIGENNTGKSNFERFTREVGVAPMEYLLTWRMALAKDLLQRDGGGVAEVAEKVGYRSASSFSVAFARHVGVPPARYAREVTEGTSV